MLAPPTMMKDIITNINKNKSPDKSDKTKLNETRNVITTKIDKDF
jgi:hypothetical protein